MAEKYKTCAFTGHRPNSLPWGLDENDDRCIEVKKELKKLILNAIDAGYTHFISGMAEGIDLIASEIVLGLKYDHPEITLECAIPFKAQASRWTSRNQERYSEVLSHSDKINMLSASYYHGCLHVRNKYMVDNSSLLIAVYNGSTSGGTASTIRYATKMHSDVWIINC